jgi:hypothetical protein
MGQVVACVRLSTAGQNTERQMSHARRYIEV